MRERKGNIWDNIGKVDAICIPTNGIVKANRNLVMGAGMAMEATIRRPGIAYVLGSQVGAYGNHPFIGGRLELTWLVSFPTKHHWKDTANIELIQFSAKSLVRLTNERHWEFVALPRVGCGLGQLEWTDVKHVLWRMLDDRFIVFYR